MRIERNMVKYTRKIVVDAQQYYHDNKKIEAIIREESTICYRFAGPHDTAGHKVEKWYAEVRTQYGTHMIPEGHWVVTDERGNVSCFDDESFRSMFQVIEVPNEQ